MLFIELYNGFYDHFLQEFRKLCTVVLTKQDI